MKPKEEPRIQNLSIGVAGASKWSVTILPGVNRNISAYSPKMAVYAYTKISGSPGPVGAGALAEIFVYAYTALFGLYTLMFLFTPGKMVTDHFDAPATPMLKFWIRGSAFGFITMLYLINRVETEEAVKVGTASAFLCGVLYPWNAKFGYATDGKLPVKYPMHYVPELLMTGLTAFGAYVLASS